MTGWWETRRVGALVGLLVIVVPLIASCGSTTASTASSASSASTASPGATTIARCAAYRELSALDVHVHAEQARLSDDWPRLRIEMAAA